MVNWLTLVLCLILVIRQSLAEDSHHYEWPPYDGWYNNLAHPDWGAAETQLFRRVPPAYGDGVYEPSGKSRPNPIDISESVFNGSTGLRSGMNRTALMVFFGQQVVEEILDAQRPGCPPEYFNIKIPKNHHQYDPDGAGDKMLPLLRSRYDMNTGFSPNVPRQQLNEISAWFDGTLTYGPNKAWTDVLRSYENGRLKSLQDSNSSDYNFPALNDIRLPMANPPPPRDNVLKPIKRFYKHNWQLSQIFAMGPKYEWFSDFGELRFFQSEVTRVWLTKEYKHLYNVDDGNSGFYHQGYDNVLGNPRGNENSFLLTFGILWFRYHNYWANRIHTENPEYDDERIFNEARKMVIGVHQKIVMYDWLPSWINATIEPYDNSYDPTVNPGIAHVFQSAAMRFGHTLVPPGVFRRNATCYFHKTTTHTKASGKDALRTCNVYWNPQEGVSEYDIDDMLMGMASQVTEREDMIITPDLRGDVFGPLEFSRRDLMAINIQRARDHGIPDYNTVREFYGLERRTNFSQINPTLYDEDPEIFDRLSEVYGGDINNLDLWPAGMMETTISGPGETFQTIIKDQFLRIRNGDRFWFENYKLNKLYSAEEVALIKSITIYEVIMSTTDIPPDAIQQNPFFFQIGDPCPQPFQLNQTDMEECTKWTSFDYFTGSEWSYALSFTALFSTFFACVGALFCVAKVHQRNVDKHKAEQRDQVKRKSDPGLIQAVEWVSKKEGYRDVKIHLKEAKKQILVQNSRGKLLRTIDLNLLSASGSNTVDFIMTADKSMRMMAIRIPREYDLTLEFSDNQERQMFYTTAKDFFAELGVSFRESHSPHRAVLFSAVTKETRYRELERYFAEIFKILNQSDALDESGHPKRKTGVLKFDNSKDKDNFYQATRQFISSYGLGANSPRAMTEKRMKEESHTKEKRQKILETFFRAVFAHAFKYETAAEDLDRHSTQEAITCELTKYEFAEALALKPTSLFVENMFKTVDKDNNGYISFREFLDMITIFSKGSAEQKAKLMFDMYDLDGSGTLSKDEFKTMIRSLMELANDDLNDTQVENLFEAIHLETKKEISFAEFNAILKDYKDTLSYANLQLNVNAGDMPTKPKGGVRDGGISRAQKTLVAAYRSERDDRRRQSSRRFSTSEEVKTVDKTLPKSPLVQKWLSLKSFIETYRMHIFWAVLYTLVTAGVFIERAYYYSIEREHGGLRQIAGYGVTVTRGAASAMMFTYSCLLVTMCRNIITKLRETILHRYIPFDAAVSFHKYIAYLALFFTIMHCIGHSINFYHISTQTADDLTCLFRNFFHATDELPKFHYWLYETLTGFTGILLTITVFIMYVFAQQYARRNSFRAFWITHHLYILLFFFMILHGAGRLVQPPFLHYFFLGPVLLFTFDKLISVSRRKVEIQVLKVDILPSDVTHLRFSRPQNFEYRAGQWVRIASLVIGENEYHPFTLTSAPHEEWLSLHIRAVGPWTMSLRKLYDPNNLKEHALPKIFLDGPYGEGHQDWYKYDVAVLVGGGIGVTPFASILKDLAQKSKSKEKIQCKKVYFLWVTRTQKQFEWLTDIIREVEENDVKDLVSVHIFITQYKEKFDVRTTMLYICERYFQKISHRSLFTGLRSITHFGRPNFSDFFRLVQAEHNNVNVFGVFSCGPPPMTASVEKGCTQVNKQNPNTLFVHHFENF